VILQRAIVARAHETGRPISWPSAEARDGMGQDSGFGDFIRVGGDVPLVRLHAAGTRDASGPLPRATTPCAPTRARLTVLVVKGPEGVQTPLKASTPMIQPFVEQRVVEFPQADNTATQQLPRTLPLPRAHDSIESRPQTALASSRRRMLKTVRPTSAASAGGWGPWSDDAELDAYRNARMLLENKGPDKSRSPANVPRPASTPPAFPAPQSKSYLKTYATRNVSAATRDSSDLQLDVKPTRHSRPDIKGAAREDQYKRQDGGREALSTNGKTGPNSSAELSRESVRAENSRDSIRSELYTEHEHAWPAPNTFSLSVRVRRSSSKLPWRSSPAAASRSSYAKQTNTKSAHEALIRVDSEEAGILQIEPCARRQGHRLNEHRRACAAEHNNMGRLEDEGGAEEDEDGNDQLPSPLQLDAQDRILNLSFDYSSAQLSDENGLSSGQGPVPRENCDLLSSRLGGGYAMDGSNPFLHSVFSRPDDAQVRSEPAESPIPARWTSAGRAMGLHEDPFFRVNFEFDSRPDARPDVGTARGRQPEEVDLLDYHQYQQNMKKRTQRAAKQSQRKTRAQTLLSAKVSTSSKLPYQSPLDHIRQHPRECIYNDGPAAQDRSPARPASRRSAFLTPRAEVASSSREPCVDEGGKHGLAIWQGNNKSAESEAPMDGSMGRVKRDPSLEWSRNVVGRDRVKGEHSEAEEKRARSSLDAPFSDRIAGFRSSLFMRPSPPQV
jgi:hypothetical protein